MGHNRSGVVRKARLRRKKKEMERLAAKADKPAAASTAARQQAPARKS